MTRRAIILALAVGVVATGAGCGGNDRTRQFDDPVVPAAAVDRYPAGSPARSLLETWRALQFNVPTTLAANFSPPLELNAARNAAIAGVSRIASGLGTPRVLSVRQRGDHAVVAVRIGGLALRLPMVRVGRHWAIAGFGG